MAAWLTAGIGLVAAILTVPSSAWAQNCGAEGQRACTVFERIPSCDPDLVERNWRCEHPACGRLGEAACDFFTRSNSCDQGLAEFSGACFTFGDCGYEGGRPCTVVESFPSCDPDLIESGPQCVHPPCGRVGEVACGAFQRLPSCDGALIEYAGRCWVSGACGSEGGRPCTWAERVPSCDPQLVERSGVCVRLDCGQLGQRPCSVFERIPSCDPDLIEYGPQCLTFGECGGERQRPCLANEQFPSCDPDLYDDWGTCIHPYDSYAFGACAVSANGVALPGTLTPTLVQASYKSPWDPSSLTTNDLMTNMGVLNAVCRAEDGSLVESTLDSNACVEQPFVDTDGVLRCSIGSPAKDLRFVSDRGGCKRYWLDGVTLHATCSAGNEEIADITKCVGGISVHSTRGLVCQERELPVGSYLETCVDIILFRDVLWAQCLDQQGNYQSTNLNGATRCTRKVYNVHGQLACGPPAQVAVFNLVGKKLSEVRALIAFNRLQVGAVRSNGQAGTEDAFIVVSQNPAAGKVVSVGTIVDLEVTRDPEMAGVEQCLNQPVQVVRCADCNGYLTDIDAIVCDEDQYLAFLKQVQFFECSLTEGECRP